MDGREMASLRSDAQPWTREQIEAWVRHYDESAHLSERGRASLRLARGTLVRLCPEAPDYDEIKSRVVRLRGARVRAGWHESATDDEIVAHITKLVAALWHHSTAASPKPLSAEREAEKGRE